MPSPTSSEGKRFCPRCGWIVGGPPGSVYLRDKAEREAERLRERCSRTEALLTDVLAILPPELALRVEARMPAINPDTRKV